MNEEPGATELKINAASNSTTGLGSSIVELGANEGTDGPSSTNLGQFTIPAIWSGGTAAEPPTYSQKVAGTQSFTITAPTTTSMPTGFFQVGDDAISWSDIKSGTSPLPIYTVDNTILAADLHQRRHGDLEPPPATAATDPLSAAQEPADRPGGALGHVENGLGAAFTAFAGMTVKTFSGTTGTRPVTCPIPGPRPRSSPMRAAPTPGAAQCKAPPAKRQVVVGRLGRHHLETDGADRRVHDRGDRPHLQRRRHAVARAANVGLSHGVAGHRPDLDERSPGPTARRTRCRIPVADTSAQQPRGRAEPGQPQRNQRHDPAGRHDYTVNFAAAETAPSSAPSPASRSAAAASSPRCSTTAFAPRCSRFHVATFPDPDGLQLGDRRRLPGSTTDVGRLYGAPGRHRRLGDRERPVVAGSRRRSIWARSSPTMIAVQRAYSAAAKVITTTDSMLSDLINVIPQ